MREWNKRKTTVAASLQLVLRRARSPIPRDRWPEPCIPQSKGDFSGQRARGPHRDRRRAEARGR